MNAFFATHKPAGMSSNHFLSKLKRKYGLGKCGYSGTLDPFASGLLLVGCGAYTKLFDYLDKRKKSYEATLWLGAVSESLDIERVEKVDCIGEFDEVKIREVLESFVGEVSYTPPRFSAKHIDGKRAYELARHGVEFELKKCEMQIFCIELIAYKHPFLSFRVSVSEGAYIRSLGNLIAQKLGVNGALSALKRISEGSIKVGKKEIERVEIFPHLLLEKIELNEYQDQIKHGKKIKIEKKNVAIHTPYLVVFEEFFSIIEFNEKYELKYRLNRMPRC